MKTNCSPALPPATIALVDDDSAFAEEMRKTLELMFDKEGKNHEFAAYPNAEAFWADYDAIRPDIVFFDISLPGESGIDAAKKLYRMDKRPVIVFVTASPDYAAQGYGVNAIGYLVKPLTEQALDELLDAARERLHPPASATLTVRDANGIRAINLAGVTHMESRNRRVLFHCGGETVVCVATLADFQPKLPESFLQVHKSFIVNMDRVKALRTAELLLDDGTTVSVSRSRKDATAEFFFARLAGETEGGQ